MPAEPRRTAVLIDVTTFEGELYDQDGERLPADRGRPNPLPFGHLVDEFAATLPGFGYRVHQLRELLTGAIWPELKAVIDDHDRDDVVIAYLMTHGFTNPGVASLEVMGRDGRAGERSNVTEWLNHCLTRGDDGPYVLFLLDVCRAGQAVRMDSWLRETGPRNVWILAACRHDQSAFDAHLTRALTANLRAILDGRETPRLPPTWPNMPLPQLAQKVAADVKALCASQDVEGSDIKLTTQVDHLPFFRNPRFNPEALEAIPRPRQLSGLIGDSDADHFITAAACHAGAGDHTAFTGRGVEIAALTGWLTATNGSSLHVLAGRAGSGKSALLSVLVCTAHPALQWHGDQVRARVDGLPAYSLRLAAFNARNRDVTRCVSAIGRQLFGNPDFSVASLIEAILRDGRQLILAVDALDEAADPHGLLTDLLLPLTRVESANGRAACRVLVTLRNDSPVAAAARKHAAGAVTDLEPSTDVELARLRADLTQYVLTLLGGTGSRGQHLEALAAGVAGALTRPGFPPELGEFLVARLYVEHLTRSGQLPADPVRAGEIGAAVPPSLAGVFELDRRLRTRHWLRPVLAALALARGNGLPASVIPAVVSTLITSGRRTPTDAEVADALKAAGSYLRIVPGDEVALYRLFHDGLAEHLRRHPFDPDREGGPDAEAVYRALLASVPTGARGLRNWELTSGYLRRHIVGYAIEAGTAGEVLSEPRYLLANAPEPSQAVTELATEAGGGVRAIAAAAAEVIRASQALGPQLDTTQRASRLAIEAIRHNHPALADALLPRTGAVLRPRLVLSARHGVTTMISRPVVAVSADRPGIGVWEFGDPPRELFPLPTASPVTALAAFTHRGREELAVGCSSGQLALWPVDASAQPPKPRRQLDGHRFRVLAVAVVEIAGRPVLASADRQHIRLWNIEFGELLRLLPLRRLNIDGLVPAVLPGGGDGLVVHSPGAISVLDPVKVSIARSWQVPGGFSTVLTIGGRPAGVHWPGNGTVRWIDPITGDVSSWSGDTGEVSAAVAVAGADEAAVVTGDDSGRLMIWDLERETQHLLGTVAGAVHCLASGVVAGMPVILCAAGGTVSMWAYRSRSLLRSAPVTAGALAVPTQGAPQYATSPPLVACGAGFEGAVLAAATGDGRVAVRHVPADGSPTSEIFVPDVVDLTSLDVLSKDGWAAVVIRDAAGRVRAWHCLTGTLLGDSLAMSRAGDDATVLAALKDAGSSTQSQAPVVLVDDRLAAVTGDEDGTLAIRPPGPGAAGGRRIVAHAGPVTAVAAWGSGRQAYAASCGADARLQVSNLTTGERVAVAGLPAPGRSLLLVPAVPAAPPGTRHLVVETGDDAICFEYAPPPAEES